MVFTASIENLQVFAEEFWRYAQGKKVFAVYGAMGAGKTTIIAALCKHKNVQDVISSPTFSIINEYHFIEHGEEKIIFHIDLYRLNSREEITQAGVEDCIFSGEICFVEWPEKASDLFEDAAHVFVDPLSETIRSVKILAASQLNNAEQS
ncbi:MAG: tRNA (adenosine(37)-N6)-threonylcarbamoyltransferase complex ATPase subunit type 1 TsaE [Chitinophagaceae bacterium]|nr:tRNA (adenosine(37)-N6)-threonylcarbamoyltransferase complex ATPase subunit type 1 TsaE [Chitinophagaceae bacterium]